MIDVTFESTTNLLGTVLLVCQEDDCGQSMTPDVVPEHAKDVHSATHMTVTDLRVENTLPELEDRSTTFVVLMNLDGEILLKCEEDSCEAIVTYDLADEHAAGLHNATTITIKSTPLDQKED